MESEEVRDTLRQRRQEPYQLPLYVLALERWEANIKKHSRSSGFSEFLDCEGFRILSHAGSAVFPFVLTHLEAECSAQITYDTQEAVIKRRVFGSDGVKVHGKDYERLCEESDYQELRSFYDAHLHLKPGHLWTSVVRANDDTFYIPEEKKGRMLEMMLFTRNWLREKLNQSPQ